MRQTHARTHNQYRMEVSEVFEVEREGEAENFMDVGNRCCVCVWITLPICK